MSAEGELLRLLRAVKAHSTGADSDHDDYADAFDEDAVLLCLNALQATTDVDAWRPSEKITELVDELLDWCIGSLELKRSTKMSLLTVRWRFVSRAIDVHAADGSETLAEKMMARMTADRFAALEVQYTMAHCLSLAVHHGVLTTKESALELLKQFYVTLHRADAREQLGGALVDLMKTKDDVKAITKIGLFRTVVQVALNEDQALRAKRQIGVVDGDAAAMLASLYQTAALTLRHAATLVCPTAESEVVHVDGAANLSEAIVQLLLSRTTSVFEETIRILQMLVESPSFLAVLPSVPDLRGGIEKAKIFGTKPEGKPTIQDGYVRSICNQLHALLIPEIDEYEKRHGSVVGLSASLENESCGSIDQSMKAALDCKFRGNSFYQRGNFATARLFYRRAIAIVRAAEFQAEQKLASLSPDEIQSRCSIGASVQVMQRNGSVRSGMISDIEEDVEVLYDDQDEEEERVPWHRLRLRMDTNQLALFKTLAVDCAMNMGKAFAMMHDHESAIECFAHVLTIHPQYIAALYHRGVANLVLHDLKQAQQDLWQANQLCSKWKTLGDREVKKKTLHRQIVAAYKKLQALHTSKKKVDKRLIKQMLGYVSTIPGLQEDGGNED